ncbi:MAG: serine/threonine-protein kinase [Chloroflexota bacterium]
MPLAPGQILNNRYRIVKLLGQGGFGAVYRVWDTNLERARALKENLNTGREAQGQFKREAQLMADLSHPNLPKVLDYFSISHQGDFIQYLVMEYIEGEDLEQMSKRWGRGLPEAQVLPWIGQVCEALEYLHTQRPPIIHRDIKPANIKITPEGKAVLVDFGIAKAFDPGTRTAAGARAVTPGYSPFEQYGRQSTDARSDVYALGATLYCLLTGVTPPESIDRATGAVVMPAPRQINPGISAQTEAAILRAMALMPEQRFPGMQAFKAALVTASQSYHLGDTYLAPVLPRPAASTAYQAAEGVASAPPSAPRQTGQARPLPRPANFIALLMIAAAIVLLLVAVGNGHPPVFGPKESASPPTLTNAQVAQQRRTATALESQRRAVSLTLTEQARYPKETTDSGKQDAQKLAATRTALAQMTAEAIEEGQPISTDARQSTAQWYSSQPVTWSIPFLNASVKKLRFYAQDSQEVPFGSRTYLDAFPRQEPYQVCAELHLSHAAPGRVVYVTFESVLFQPDETYQTWDRESWLEAKATISQHDLGCTGWEYAGGLPAGRYTWNVFIGAQKIALASFEIIE